MAAGTHGGSLEVDGCGRVRAGVYDPAQAFSRRRPAWERVAGRGGAVIRTGRVVTTFWCCGVELCVCLSLKNGLLPSSGSRVAAVLLLHRCQRQACCPTRRGRDSVLFCHVSGLVFEGQRSIGEGRLPPQALSSRAVNPAKGQ